MFCRKYVQARAQRWEEREAFRRQFRRRHASVPVRYPSALLDLPPFPSWLSAEVKIAEDAGEHVEADVVQYAQPPERNAVAHRQMHAFGMHLRVHSAESDRVTCDSAVVASFTEQLRWGLREGRPIEVTKEYVGYIEEILELDYRNHCTTVLVCDWIRGNPDVRYPNIRRDEYGFTLANFNRLDGKVHGDSFAFPLHCQQVFFSNDQRRPGWKVVCRTDVRGRRGQLRVNESIPVMTNIGNDTDFAGLQPQMLDSEPRREPSAVPGTYVEEVHDTGIQEDSADGQ